jgi:uncharacterized protein (TIGR02996 family)
VDDRRALMAAIIGNPDEDTPRLALADWLQEHGDAHDQARAEFIRLQIAAENETDKPACRKLAVSAKKLARKHGKAWLAPLAALDRNLEPNDLLDVGRGLLWCWFVTTGTFLSKKWQAALPEALAAVGVEELFLYSPTKKVADLANSPALRWIARLGYPGADDAALAAFARSEQLAHLSKLELREVKFSDAGLRDFAKNARTPGLRSLTLSSEGALGHTKPRFTAAGVVALLQSDRLPRLDALEITRQSAEKFGLKKLLADPALARLKTLSLVMPVKAAEVLASPHLKNLQSLQLHDAGMTDADADALLSSRTFAKLRELDLYLDSRLGPTSEKKLRDRFGEALTLEYSDD